jgi:hypothetical protein
LKALPVITTSIVEFTKEDRHHKYNGNHANRKNSLHRQSPHHGWTGRRSLEATVRYAAELGYEVTMVKDATADYSDEEMHAALDVNIPNYASAIVTTNEVVDLISALETSGISAQY